MYITQIRATGLMAAVFFATMAPTGASAGNVVTDWNNNAITAIIIKGGKPAGGIAAVWFAYGSIAVYDAVNAITGQYRPFYYQTSGPSSGSVDVAAAAAAHRILVNYFPAQQSDLDAQFAATLATIKADSAAQGAGIAIGE